MPQEGFGQKYYDKTQLLQKLSGALSSQGLNFSLSKVINGFDAFYGFETVEISTGWVSTGD